MMAEPVIGLRADLAFIANWVAPGSRVLDLGCGDGAMLDYLQRHKQCRGYGVEIDDAKIPRCVQRGVNVIQQNLEDGLAMFADDAFDTVLCLSALQMMKHVEEVLRDIARVGREAIVSFPNFAHWPHRLSLMMGRMPVSESLPYQWYDTPNIRVGTHADFEVLARRNGLTIEDSFGLHEGREVRFLPNLLASTAVFRFSN